MGIGRVNVRARDSSEMGTDSVVDVSQNTRQVLQELLDEELGTDPTTVRGLTNHLPMALVAKAGLGRRR